MEHLSEVLTCINHRIQYIFCRAYVCYTETRAWKGVEWPTLCLAMRGGGGRRGCTRCKSHRRKNKASGFVVLTAERLKAEDCSLVGYAAT